jgi:DNA-binding PadR family transcriptional regulator
MQRSMIVILSALVDGEADSGELLARLRRLDPTDAPSLATFYRRIKEGVDEGWIEVVAGAGGEAGRGRPAQIYRVTDAGRTAARAEAERWRAVSERLLRGETAR